MAETKNKNLRIEFKKYLDKIFQINQKARKGSKLKSITCYILEIAGSHGY